jgi:hypothetical protein
MFSRTTIVVATVVVLTTIATLYVYWTRTPQYTLLQVLDAYATRDHDAAAEYLNKEPPRKQRLHIQRRTENVIRHLAALQNETLAHAYRVAVEASRVDGKNAELLVRLNGIAYRLTFHEQNDGRWKLMEFDERDVFSAHTMQHRRQDALFLLARL